MNKTAKHVKKLFANDHYVNVKVFVNTIFVYLGLKAFTGLSGDLSKTEDVKQATTAKDTVQNTVEEDSDSDSDYEYFKVQKQLAAKVKVDKNSEDEDSDEDVEETKPVPEVNTFAEAVKSAVGEDELVLPATVNQTFLIVPMKLRLVTLCSLIVEHCVVNKRGGKMIVFMATLEMVDYHSELIELVLTGKDVKVKKKKLEKGKAKKRKANEDEVNKYILKNLELF